MTTQQKQTVREILEAIAQDHGGQLTPEMVVEHAKDQSSPLHRCFEWNNSKAAAEYRLIQAGIIIRKVKVTYEASEEKTIRVRAFVNVRPTADTSAKERGTYVSFEDAVSKPEYREQVLAAAARDASAFRQKYSSLREAQNIIEAIDRAFPS